MKIYPRGEYLLVKPDPAESKENSFGLITPSNVEQEAKAMGEVLGFGKDIDDVKKGDHVIYGVFAGETVKVNEKGKEVEYKLLHSDDVIAFVE